MKISSSLRGSSFCLPLGSSLLPFPYILCRFAISSFTLFSTLVLPSPTIRCRYATSLFAITSLSITRKREREREEERKRERDDDTPNTDR